MSVSISVQSKVNAFNPFCFSCEILVREEQNWKIEREERNSIKKTFFRDDRKSFLFPLAEEFMEFISA